MKDWPFACTPRLETLTRVVRWNRRSRTKTSPTPLVSPGTRSVASEEKATYRPSALNLGATLRPSARAPLLETLAISVAGRGTGTATTPDRSVHVPDAARRSGAAAAARTRRG